MIIEIAVFWLGLGIISALVSSFLVVRPSRQLAIMYFEEELNLSRTNFYMYSKRGTLLHYTVHSVLSLISGPIVGFLTTLAKDSAIRGYTKSIISSGKDDLCE